MKEYVVTKDGVFERDFDVREEHKYGHVFSIGGNSRTGETSKYVRIEKKEDFLADYNIGDFDVLDFFVERSDGSIKLFRPDDFFGLGGELNIPGVKMAGSGFSLDYREQDIYYIVENRFYHELWLGHLGFENLWLPAGVTEWVSGIKFVDGEPVSYKKYGTQPARDPYKEVGTFLVSGENVYLGGEQYLRTVIKTTQI